MADYKSGLLAGILAQHNTLSDLRPVTANANMLAQAMRARENQFQTGIKATPWYSEFIQKYGEQPNLNSPDYDYRAAWRGGARPERYAPDGGAYHWPSSLPNGTMLKSADHPTAWMETFMRVTGKDPLTIGVTTPEMAQQFLYGQK